LNLKRKRNVIKIRREDGVMRTNRKIAFLLTVVVLAALLCACAENAVTGEWKNDETGMRIAFKGNGTGVLYTPMFGAELENELTYAVNGDRLTIGFVNADGTESTEAVMIQNGTFTYTGLNFVHQG